MLATSKTLSLIEQKKLQWAKEREEMMGLCGLWGRPRNISKNENQISFCNKNNLLPPIEGKNNLEKPPKEQHEEESETSGYQSDSPKHLVERDADKELHFLKESDAQLNNKEQQQYWNEVEKSECLWDNKNMYKNYKNENWTHQNTESFIRQNPRLYETNKNFWYGTPESVSSDDGSRLRWGDRGVGIGHLWEPVINPPDCRLPHVADHYRQTPKWVEKGLKNVDGNKADILIIHHPDDDIYDQTHKNFLLGQNAPIPLEVIEEREKKRKKALEHQNAIKKQLEERELRRKKEKENKIREERLEEERIKKEQEIERLRYEEEQKKIKQKEEIERKKEEVMREAIEVAEKRAREEKKKTKRHFVNDMINKNYSDTEKLEKILEQTEMGLNGKKQFINTSKHKKVEEKTLENVLMTKKDQNEKTLKDCSSQFDEIELANNFQFLNMNSLPMDGGLALMLDNPSKDGFLLPPEGVQLALLMSPRNANSSNRLTATTCDSVSIGERTLTPSKYRIKHRMRFSPSNKSTQTEFKFSSAYIKPSGYNGKGRKQYRRCGTNSGSSVASQKCNSLERHHKHIRCFVSSKYRSKTHSSKINLEDRPKWGINRPSVQYKKQSEKDPYYQKKLKERLKKAAELGTSTDPALIQQNRLGDGKPEEKELNSVVRLLDCRSDDEKPLRFSEEAFFQNGYRMNSNLSSPVFVPIGTGLASDWKKPEIHSERSRSNDSMSVENEDINEKEEPAVSGSVGFLTQTQLETIKQITSLREGLKKLQKDYSNSRSITPFSDRSVEK